MNQTQHFMSQNLNSGRGHRHKGTQQGSMGRVEAAHPDLECCVLLLQ